MLVDDTLVAVEVQRRTIGGTIILIRCAAADEPRVALLAHIASGDIDKVRVRQHRPRRTEFIRHRRATVEESPEVRGAEVGQRKKNG